MKLSKEDRIKRFLSLLTQAAIETNLYVSSTCEGDICLMDDGFSPVCKIEWLNMKYKEFPYD